MKIRIVWILLGSLMVGSTGCRTAAGTGALAGTFGGAAIGAAVDRHHAGRGALIGAAAGLVVGTLAGAAVDASDERREREARMRAARERRVVVTEYTYPETGDRYVVEHRPAPASNTQVTTTVTRWNPSTGQWEVVSETTQPINQ